MRLPIVFKIALFVERCNTWLLRVWIDSNSNVEPMSTDDLAKIVEEGRTSRSGKIGSAEIVVRSRCTTDVVGRCQRRK